MPVQEDHMFGFLGWIVFGLVAGVIAKLLMPGRDPGGFFITAGIGILGSIIATYGGKALGFYSGEETAGFIGAFVGAIILLVLYRVLMRGRST